MNMPAPDFDRLAARTATNIKKANIALMRHPETKTMAGIFVSGNSRLTTDIATACTDGWNKSYNPIFMDTLTYPEQVFVVAHENMHVFLKHIPRFRSLMKTDGRLINAAMDYALNAFLHGIKDRSLMKMPACVLYDAQFDNMSVMEIYSILKKNSKTSPKPQPGQGQGNESGEPGQGEPQAGDTTVEINGKNVPLDGHDQHDEGTSIEAEGGKESDEEIIQKIDRAIQQGAILAGVMGKDLPRIVQEAMEVPVRWDAELEEFVTSTCSNRDDYSYRRLDRRWLASNEDMQIVPTLMQESIAEVMIAADASGSICDAAMGKWLATVARICEAAQPDVIRVVFWDMNVCSEQIFDRSQIAEIATLMKPRGGGGTHVGCVANYIKQRSLSPDCLIVLTDGWVEPNIQWDISVPTLWTVTENAGFRPPAGRVVKINN